MQDTGIFVPRACPSRKDARSGSVIVKNGLNVNETSNIPEMPRLRPAESSFLGHSGCALMERTIHKSLHTYEDRTEHVVAESADASKTQHHSASHATPDADFAREASGADLVRDTCCVWQACVCNSSARKRFRVDPGSAVACTSCVHQRLSVVHSPSLNVCKRALSLRKRKNPVFGDLAEQNINSSSQNDNLCRKESHGADLASCSRRCRRALLRLPRRRIGECSSAKWFNALRKLSPEARRCLIECRLSERERLALERWILEQRSATVKARSRLLEKARHGPITWNQWQQLIASSGRLVQTAEFSTEVEKWRSWNQQGYDVLQACCGTGSRQDDASHGGSKVDEAMQFSGIVCRWYGGRCAYAATGTVKGFRLFTRFDRDLVVAVRFRNVLIGIREAVHCLCGTLDGGSRNCAEALEVCAVDSTRLEDVFRHAVVEEPRKWGVDADRDMGLRFSICIGARYWVGRQLLSPRFPISAIDDGLCAWRRLKEARSVVYLGPTNRYSILQRHTPLELQAAWRQLRKVYLDICVMAGKDREKVAASLLDLEASHASVRDRRMARWQRLTSRKHSRRCVSKKTNK
mmetsp:Transcript_21212/g.73038  ORF Transcript_21212/g.73038 Transcript_21212/m.73038 type:complete len:580 (-) Transcript_21212:158-1897(-)